MDASRKRGRESCWCSFDDRPADQAEPREAVVEGVPTSQSVVTVLDGTAGELCGAIVHFSHQVQSLPGKYKNNRK